MIDPELIAAILEETEKEEELVILNLHTHNGTINLLTEDGEWVDLSEQWPRDFYKTR